MAYQTPVPAMDVIILAGGKGTRLQAVVSDNPKPMAEVNGRPFLDYHLAQLARSPLIGTVVLALGHLARKVVEHYEAHAPALPLTYVIEDQPLGTGGAVRHALSSTARPLVLVMNGDSIFEIDIAAMLETHQKAPRGVTIALLDVADASRFGSVTLEGHRVTAFSEKVNRAEPGVINAGVYLFDRQELADLPGGPLSLEHDVLPRLVAKGRLTAHVCHSDFIDIGLPETYRAAGAFVYRLFGRNLA